MNKIYILRNNNNYFVKISVSRLESVALNVVYSLTQNPMMLSKLKFIFKYFIWRLRTN